MKGTLLALTLLAAGGSLSQAQTVDYSVVVRDVDGRGLADVEVSIPAAAKRAITDSVGRARFTGITRGSYVIRARRVGFEPSLVRSPVDDDTPALVIVLKARVVTLDTVRISGKCPWRGFSGFDCRQQQGKGLFLDLAAIDSSNVDDVAKLFYDRPDFRVLRATRTGIPYVTSTYKGGRCMVVLVNGLPANGTTNQAPRYAREVLGVEAYANPQDVPVDYQKFSWTRMVPCGLVNYWTSSR